MTERMRDLRVLGGTDVNREPAKHMVIVRDGVVLDALHEYPYRIEAAGDEIIGWGRLDGPAYRLVSDHDTLETCGAELRRIGANF